MHLNLVFLRTMDDMTGSGQRFYEEDEAELILRRAASLSSPESGMTYDRILETAAELGISAEAVQRAEQEVTVERKEKALKKAFDASQKQAFFGHLASFLTVNAFLLIINLATSREELWFYWPLLGWGFGLVAHAKHMFMRSGATYQAEFARWKAARDPSNVTRQVEASGNNNGPQVTIGVHIGSRREELLQSRIDRAKARLDRIDRLKH
jgi:hypothetical protein